MTLSSKYLTVEEDEALRRLLASDATRDALMLKVLRRCGMRPSELLAVRERDLNRSQQSLRIRGLKGSNDRELPLGRKLFAQVTQLAQGLKSDERVFKVSYQRLQQIWDWYRPCRKPLKSLRHTVGVTLYQKSRDILLVKDILGHKSLSSTMVYMSYVNSVEAMNLLMGED